MQLEAWTISKRRWNLSPSQSLRITIVFSTVQNHPHCLIQVPGGQRPTKIQNFWCGSCGWLYSCLGSLLFDVSFWWWFTQICSFRVALQNSSPGQNYTAQFFSQLIRSTKAHTWSPTGEASQKSRNWSARSLTGSTFARQELQMDKLVVLDHTTLECRKLIRMKQWLMELLFKLRLSLAQA